MKFRDLFLLSTRMFKARASRTFLTILGMSVGIGAILFLVSLGYGLQKTLLEKITTSDSLLTLDVTSNRTKKVELNKDFIDQIKSISGVAKVSPAYQLEAQGKMDNLRTDLNVTVVDSDYLKLAGIKLVAGQPISGKNIKGIVISTPIAKIFGKDAQNVIGQEMSFSFSLGGENRAIQLKNNNGDISKNQLHYNPVGEFKIVGVIDSDESVVYLNTQALKELKILRFSQLKVKCQNSKMIPAVQIKITQLGFLVSSLSDTVDQANKVFRVVKIVLMLFGIIALIVSAIGMFNTMTITLLERTEEIGIMKSIGASDAMISLMFVMESTIMGLLGGIVGIIIGWLEGEIFNFAVNLVATHFGGEKVNLFYSPLWFVLSIIIFSAVVGFLTGVIPARRASRIDPLEALRYK